MAGQAVEDVLHGVFYISQYVDQGNLDGALQYTQSMIAQANMDQVRLFLSSCVHCSTPFVSPFLLASAMYSFL
jgi:hypothetical protein